MRDVIASTRFWELRSRTDMLQVSSLQKLCTIASIQWQTARNISPKRERIPSWPITHVLTTIHGESNAAAQTAASTMTITITATAITTKRITKS
jgi:hypothetical protein